MGALRTAILILLALTAPAAAQEPPPAALDADGLWRESWLHPTSGDLGRDLAAAASQGRILALFWERPGCEHCAALHVVALRRPELAAFFTGPFYAVRLQRFGDDDITDFDGTRARERDIARRHGVIGTPTIEFRLGDGTEVFRVPGAATPEVLRAAFEYVTLGGYLTASFADWLEARGLI